MGKWRDPWDAWPKVDIGRAHNGAIGPEIGAFGGSTGIYIGADGNLSIESESPAGHGVQWFHSQPDVDLDEVVATDDHTFTLRGDQVTSFLQFEPDGKDGSVVTSSGDTQTLGRAYVTDDGERIGWSAGPSSARRHLGSHDEDIQPGHDPAIVWEGTILDDATQVVDGAYNKTELHLTTVDPQGGGSYVLVENDPGPLFAAHEVLYTEGGIRIQRLAEQPIGEDGALLMRPAATGQIELPDDRGPDEGDRFAQSDSEGGSTSEQGSGYNYGDFREAEAGTLEPNATTSGADTPAPRPSSNYTIQSGDTLSDIAAETGATVGELVGANAIADPDHIEPGADLYVPADDGYDSPERPPGDFMGGPVDSGGDVPELNPASGAHPAGQAAQPAPPEGVNSPQGDFTAGAVDSNSEEVELDADKGAHPAGEAAESNVDTGRVAAGLGHLGTGLSRDDGLDTFAGATNLLAAADTGDSTSLDDTASGLSALASIDTALDNDNDIGALSSGLDLADNFVDSSALNTAAGVAGGVASLASLDSAVDNDNWGGVAQGLSTAADAVGSMLGEQALNTAASTLGNVVPYIGMFTAMANGNPMGAMISAVTMINPVVGAVVAVVASLLGGGDPPPPPEAEATLELTEAGTFEVTTAGDAHGGNAGGMAEAAHQAGTLINGLLDATGGRLKDPGAIDSIRLGYDGDGVYVNDQSVDGVGQAIGVIIREVLGDAPIEGGDVYVKRALYRQLEGDGELDIAAVQQAIETARDYSAQQDQQPRLEQLAADPAIQDELEALENGEIDEDALSDGAAALHQARETAERAEELGIDQSHRFDQASRLNDAFAQKGVDLDGVSLDELVIHQQQDELIVAIADPANPDAAIRDLPHAQVDGYAGDVDAAMLYLGDTGHNLANLLEQVSAGPASGAVKVGEVLAREYAADGEGLIAGTGRGDTLAGSSQADVLVGWQGGDTLTGGGGDDRLIGGAGADRLDGGSGADTADYRFSGEGVAVDLEAGEGRGGSAAGDVLEDIENVAGSEQGDRLAGDDADNVLHGRGGADHLDGRGGDDRLAGHDGNDTLAGAGGDDRLAGGAGNDRALGGEGDDVVMGNRGSDQLDGGAGDDLVLGGEGADLLAGAAGRDRVEGGSGDDIIVAAAEGDHIDGGAGADTAVYGGSWQDYRVELGDNGQVQVRALDGGGVDRLDDVEQLAFDDQRFRIEELRETLDAWHEADEEERYRRQTGMPTSSATGLGDAAALGILGLFAPTVADAAPVGLRLVPVAANDGNAPVLAVPEGTSLLTTGGWQGAVPYTDGAADRASAGTTGHDGGTGGGGGGRGGDADGTATPASAEVPEPVSVSPPNAPRAHEAVPADGEASAQGGDAEGDGDTSGDTTAAVSDGDGSSTGYGGDVSAGVVVVRGTPGDDVLRDEHGFDRIKGLAGDDVLIGLDGDDTLKGASGDDLLVGGAGADTLDGGAGHDTATWREADAGVVVALAAGTGDEDTLRSIEGAEGSAFDDRLAGAATDNTLFGGGGADTLDGLGGDDELVGGAGRDQIDGDRGDDRLFGEDGADRLVAGRGDDRARGGDGADEIDGGRGADHLAGGTGADDLRGASGDDALFGGGGRDSLAGARGADVLTAGAGEDTVTGGEGTDALFGEAGRDRLHGGAGADRLQGGGGADALLGAGSADALFGGADADTLEGGLGDDRLAGGDGADELRGNGGHDELLGGADGDDLAGDDGDDRLEGGAGNDRLRGLLGADALAGDTGDDDLTGGAGRDDLRGGGGADALAGGLGADELLGGAGRDELDGGAGTDRVRGGHGDDLLRGATGDDLLRGGAGGNELLGAAGIDDLDGGLGADRLVGGDGADTLAGGVGADRLDGGADGDTLNGGYGGDTLLGRAAADSLSGDAGGDRLHGGGGGDELAGGTGMDTAEGGTGADRLWGDAGADTLRGNAGDDDLLGGDGADTLAGGAGVDVLSGQAGDDTLAVDDADDLAFVDGGAGHDAVRLDGRHDGNVDLAALNSVETVAGSEYADTFDGTFGVERIDGNGGDDRVRFDDVSVFDVAAFDWSDDQSELTIEHAGESVTVTDATVEFAEGDVALGGVDNAPFIRPGSVDTLQGTEDRDLRFRMEDIEPEVFDVDPGAAKAEVLSVAGIDAGLTRSLGAGYWQGGDPSGETEGAAGSFRTGTFGTVRHPTPSQNRDYGRRPDDHLAGDGGDDELFGQILTRYSGTVSYPRTNTLADSDRLFGRGGDDILVGGGNADLLHGGSGRDTADYSRSDANVRVVLPREQGYSGSADGDTLRSIENVVGSAHDDKLRGDGADNALRGGRGEDVLIGEQGDDTLVGGRGARDTAVFRGERHEYSVEAVDDHLVVDHGSGRDGRDELYGVESLEFADARLHIGEADARHGDVRATDDAFIFQPDSNFNNLDGEYGEFTVTIGNGEGARRTDTARVDVTPVNDAPGLLPGEVNYSGHGRLGTHEIQVGNRRGDYYDEYAYAVVQPTDGRVLGNDIEDGTDLSYELVRGPDNGRLDMSADGSFTYSMNTGDDAASVRNGIGRNCTPTRHGGQDCEFFSRKIIEPATFTEREAGMHESFLVNVTDSGENPEKDDAISKTIRVRIENDYEDGSGNGLFPVALDLDDNGLDFSDIDDSDVLADIDDDDSEENIAWIGGNDGLLMLDRDGDGEFSSPEEISFVDDHPDARTDMEGLALAFDTNGDGLLGAEDARWGDFRVWQDADGDATSDPGELRSLQEAGIESIGVVPGGETERAAGGDVTLHGRSEFTRTDGTTGVAGDVEFGARAADAAGADPESDDQAGPPAPSDDEMVAMIAQRIVQAQGERGSRVEDEPDHATDGGTAYASHVGADELAIETSGG